MGDLDDLQDPTRPLGSIAYWLGVYRGQMAPGEILGLGGIMGLQYDYEGQADAYGRAIPTESGDDEEWSRHFRPVAPVQLARSWLPFSCAVERFGEPDAQATAEEPRPKLRVLAWSAATVARAVTSPRSSSNADEQRFLGLLRVASMRALEQEQGLLLAAQPGWSYDYPGAISKRTARLMTRAGFVVTTRRP